MVYQRILWPFCIWGTQLESKSLHKMVCELCCQIHSLPKYFWNTTYTGLAWFRDTEKNYMKILLLRSSQAGRKTRTKDENKAYHTRGGKWGLECKRHGPEGRAALLAEALQSHKCSWRTCWASMVTSMEKAQCTSQTWSLLSRAYSLANILTRNRKWKSTEACWAKGMWSALHEHRIKHEALVWKVNNKNSCKAMEPHYLHPPLSKPRQAGGGNLDSLCSSAASGAQVPKLLKSDLTWCGDTKIRQLLHDTVLNCRLNCFT